MARPLTNRLLTPSVLDRLLDDDPGVRQEPAHARGQSLNQLKESVRRDLVNLLNTRTRFVRGPEHLTQLERSLVEYGLEDFGGRNLASEAERARFCRDIEEVIRKNEPRLEEVQVRAGGEGDPLDRTFRFTISARLRVEPTPEQVQFDSRVNPATGTVVVGGGGA
jgi:type VI secretion system protein ImpF